MIRRSRKRRGQGPGTPRDRHQRDDTSAEVATNIIRYSSENDPKRDGLTFSGVVVSETRFGGRVRACHVRDEQRATTENTRLKGCFGSSGLTSETVQSGERVGTARQPGRFFADGIVSVVSYDSLRVSTNEIQTVLWNLRCGRCSERGASLPWFPA